jgi:hypothetical protein
MAELKLQQVNPTNGRHSKPNKAYWYRHHGTVRGIPNMLILMLDLRNTDSLVHRSQRVLSYAWKSVVSAGVLLQNTSATWCVLSCVAAPWRMLVPALWLSPLQPQHFNMVTISPEINDLGTVGLQINTTSPGRWCSDKLKYLQLCDVKELCL